MRKKERDRAGYRIRNHPIDGSIKLCTNVFGFGVNQKLKVGQWQWGVKSLNRSLFTSQNLVTQCLTSLWKLESNPIISFVFYVSRKHTKRIEFNKVNSCFSWPKTRYKWAYYYFLVRKNNLLNFVMVSILLTVYGTVV